MKQILLKCLLTYFSFIQIFQTFCAPAIQVDYDDIVQEIYTGQNVKNSRNLGPITAKGSIGQFITATNPKINIANFLTINNFRTAPINANGIANAIFKYKKLINLPGINKAQLNNAFCDYDKKYMARLSNADFKRFYGALDINSKNADIKLYSQTYLNLCRDNFNQAQSRMAKLKPILAKPLNQKIRVYGKVFEFKADGTQVPVKDVTIKILQKRGYFDSTNTSKKGDYEFDDLMPGNYTVSIDIPTNFKSKGHDSYDLQLNDGEEIENDFLIVSPITVTGKINEVIADKKTPKKDVEVSIMQQPDGIYKSFKTNSDGAYSFKDLPEGDFKLKIQLPDGYTSDESEKSLKLSEGEQLTEDFEISPIIVVVPPAGSSGLAGILSGSLGGGGTIITAAIGGFIKLKKSYDQIKEDLLSKIDEEEKKLKEIAFLKSQLSKPGITADRHSVIESNLHEAQLELDAIIKEIDKLKNKVNNFFLESARKEAVNSIANRLGMESSDVQSIISNVERGFKTAASKLIDVGIKNKIVPPGLRELLLDRAEAAEAQAKILSDKLADLKELPSKEELSKRYNLTAQQSIYLKQVPEFQKAAKLINNILEKITIKEGSAKLAQPKLLTKDLLTQLKKQLVIITPMQKNPLLKRYISNDQLRELRGLKINQSIPLYRQSPSFDTELLQRNVTDFINTDFMLLGPLSQGVITPPLSPRSTISGEISTPISSLQPLPIASPQIIPSMPISQPIPPVSIPSIGSQILPPPVLSPIESPIAPISPISMPPIIAPPLPAPTIPAAPALPTPSPLPEPLPVSPVITTPSEPILARAP